MKENINLYTILLLSFLVGTPALIGQTDASSIDSLEQLVSSPSNDHQHFLSLVQLAEHYANPDPELAKQYAHRALRIAQRVDSTAYLAPAWNAIRRAYYGAGQWDSLGYWSQQSLEALDKSCAQRDCPNEKALAMVDLGRSLEFRGYVKKAIQVFESAFEVPGISLRTKARIKNSQGGILNEIGNHDSALKALRLSHDYAQQDNQPDIQASAMYNTAMTYGSMDNPEEVQKRLHQCLNFVRLLLVQRDTLSTKVRRHLQDTELYVISYLASSHLYIDNIDSAYQYYQTLLSLSQQLGNIQFEASAISGLLEATSQMPDKDPLPYLRQAEHLLDVDLRTRVYTKNGIYRNLYNYYTKAGQLYKALEYAERNVDHIKAFKADTSSLIIHAYINLTQAQAAVGQYEAAWKTYDELYQIKSALVRRTQEEALARTAIEMELAENELARQQAEQATLLEQQASASRLRFFYLLLGLAAVIVVLLIWAYRRVRSDRATIAAKNEIVKASLEEKEVLLREIHHRVKNNLQIISALLDKQARKSTDENVQRLVREGQERIQSMALVHQNLYQNDQLSGIDIRTYLHELSQNIQHSNQIVAEKVELELNVAAERLDIDTAIPVGLILNELITNAYKYAFPEGRSGKIIVDFYKRAEQYFLNICDDGVGLPPDFEQRRNKSLGLNLVRGLVRQLDGKVEWPGVAQGTSIAIQF